MEKKDALSALAALAQETRLDIFRLLVEAGPDGRAAGQIGASLDLAPATLSFHLKELKGAGLVECRRDGRSLIYAADFARMNGLIGFLGDNCCQGEPALCLPALQPRGRLRTARQRLRGTA
jgi:DNA-binding transcriptional ArsR family regulator